MDVRTVVVREDDVPGRVDLAGKLAHLAVSGLGDPRLLSLGGPRGDENSVLVARREGSDGVGAANGREEGLRAQFLAECVGELLVDVRPNQQEVVDRAGEHAHVRRAGEGRP